MWTDTVESAPGTVTQVRGAAQALIRFAKRSGAAVILVGHVTKDGQIAGPARGRAYGRCRALVRGRRRAPIPHPARGEEPLRADRRDRRVRNDRRGLREVSEPSELFLSERDLGTPGTAVFAGIEGTPPAAGRDPGAGCADLARHAAPRRGRLGLQRACRWCSRCWKRIAA